MSAAGGGKHLFVTGQPGCGKSTLISSVLARLQGAGELPPGSFQGFWTAETRSPATGERAGFDVVTWERGGGSRRGLLARASAGAAAPKGPLVGKYSVDVASFERLALPALRLDDGGGGGDLRLVVIDEATFSDIEVGKMELCSRAFMPAVWAALDAGPVVFGSVPAARYGRAIPEVERLTARPDVEVVTVTKASRDELVGQLAAALAARLRQ